MTDEYQMRQFFNSEIMIKPCDSIEMGGIDKITITDVMPAGQRSSDFIKTLHLKSGPGNLKAFEPGDEEIVQKISFTIKAPTKPYWEVFGYKTEQEMMDTYCIINKETGDCYRHGQHVSKCSKNG